MYKNASYFKQANLKTNYCAQGCPDSFLKAYDLGFLKNLKVKILGYLRFILFKSNFFTSSGQNL